MLKKATLAAALLISLSAIMSLIQFVKFAIGIPEAESVPYLDLLSWLSGIVANLAIAWFFTILYRKQRTSS